MEVLGESTPQVFKLVTETVVLAVWAVPVAQV